MDNQEETYSPCLSERFGNKVGWRIYATQKEANKDSAIAVKEAYRLALVGYDYGYQFPGEVKQLEDGTWQLCVP
jgi:hypothetical protein